MTALLIIQIWTSKGYFWISTVGHYLVLSSDKEVIAYMLFPVGKENLEFSPKGAYDFFLCDLPFPGGQYEARFFDPKTGSTESVTIRIENGITKSRTPVFVDDMAVHIIH